jgi:mannosyltransferase OCH1-like enzyme
MSIPKIIHQVWVGDFFDEQLVIYASEVSLYCEINGYDYYFWNLNRSGDELFVKHDLSYGLCKISDLNKNNTVLEMIKDEKLPAVIKADILRFMILERLGGFYVDVDMIILKPLEGFLQMEYVCGHEKWTNLVCTGFLGSPSGSLVNTEAICSIVHSYEKVKIENRYPENVDEVILFSGPAMFTELIKKFPYIEPFPVETFHACPVPELKKQFTLHYFAGSKKGGWAGDGCKGKKCSICENRKECSIILEERK